TALPRYFWSFAAPAIRRAIRHLAGRLQNWYRLLRTRKERLACAAFEVFFRRIVRPVNAAQNLGDGAWLRPPGSQTAHGHLAARHIGSAHPWRVRTTSLNMLQLAQRLLLWEHRWK